MSTVHNSNEQEDIQDSYKQISSSFGALSSLWATWQCFCFYPRICATGIIRNYFTGSLKNGQEGQDPVQI